MKHCVLGGEGLIGRQLCLRLRQEGHEVVSLDLKNGHDLREPISESVSQVDKIWFLAWDTGGAKYLSDEAKQHAMYAHNSALCLRVFSLLEHTRIPFVFVTSQLAGQSSAYGITKLLGESWASHLGGKIARLWNVYGWEEPGERSHVIPDLVLGGLRDGVIACRTNGEERRQFIHVSDCAEALWILSNSEQQEADISSGAWVSIASVAHEVAGLMNARVAMGPERGAESARAPSLELRDWTPGVSLTQGLNQVVADARTWFDRQ